MIRGKGGITMHKREPLFDEYEAALLLESYVEVRNGKDRKETLHSLSAVLRQLAINRGQKIDEAFRNDDGLKGRLEAMENAWTNGEKGAKRSTELFRKIVDFYWHNRPAYDEVLQKAKQMARIPESMDFSKKIEEVKKRYSSVSAHRKADTEQLKKVIIRVVIDGFISGQNERYSYEEHLTIEPTGIWYERNPRIETSDNRFCHWSYHTDSTSFKNLFLQLALSVNESMLKIKKTKTHKNSDFTITITVTNAEHSSEIKTCAYRNLPLEFEKAVAVILKLIPGLEKRPELLNW